MAKTRSPKEVYEDLSTEGLYEEANLDLHEVEKVHRLALEDYEFGKTLRKMKDSNWRIIFNIHYDALRELCSLLLRFEKQKISNHQGLFAFVIINFPTLQLEWEFFETVRNMRNLNKYKGMDITSEMWKKIEFKMDLYFLSLDKEIKKRLS
jgi:hypothetical protein